MMEKVRVRAADFRGNGFQRHRLRAMGEEKPARGFDRGRAALFRAQSSASY
jgi:hypothetical protein